MKLKSSYKKHTLLFTFDAGTSRGVMKTRDTWFIRLTDTAKDFTGIGEAAPLPGLSIENEADMDTILESLCKEINQGEYSDITDLPNKAIVDKFPSVKFAIEMACLDLANKGQRIIFDNAFLQGEKIPINGLVWMGSKEFMKEQIESKIQTGFKCIKIKVGAINFQDELEILKFIRNEFGNELMVRLDANGAFTAENAMKKLEKLAEFNIHSIEQPIKPGQYSVLEKICSESPVPIALDEELIGIIDKKEKEQIISAVRPAYLILKPSLLGGFESCEEWINIAESKSIGWWLTSALESNIGLNAIAQFAVHKQASGYQGLGTGKLYHNNISSPLVISSGNIKYDSFLKWDLTNT